MRSKKTKTPWTFKGIAFENPNNKFGFIYLVSCKHPECKKKYIGLKFFYSNFGKKTKQKESDWATYKTSSKYVKEAIEKYGIDNFDFEIIELFDTRAGVVSAEVELQWAARVLHAVDETGERMYWNQAIGNIKFIAKEQLSEEHKEKLRGPKHSDEFKEALRERSLGNTYCSGRELSKEHKDIISKTAKLHNTKYTVCATNILTNNVSEYTGKKALEEAGFSPKYVYQCCNGKAKTHKGHTFFYKTKV